MNERTSKCLPEHQKGNHYDCKITQKQHRITELRFVAKLVIDKSKNNRHRKPNIKI